MGLFQKKFTNTSSTAPLYTIGGQSTMLIVALGTHAVAAALRLARANLLIALPTLLLAIIGLLSAVYYGDTLNGPLPGSRTFELMRIDLRLVIEQFPTAIAPVPSIGNYAVAAAAAVALCAALSDTFAFRALGHLEAVVPAGVVTVTLTLPAACGGLTAVICVGEVA